MHGRRRFLGCAVAVSASAGVAWGYAAGLGVGVLVPHHEITGVKESLGGKEHTCLAHRNPQLLHRSLNPLGPLLHSGVLRVWQFAQSRTMLPPPFRLFRFFLFERSCASSSASKRLTFSICRNSYCQDVHLVVLSSSNMFSSAASAASWCPR